MADFEFRVFVNGFSRVCMAILTCMVSLGGAIVGTITGAIKGPTTETGLVRGACVGAVTGAITALQLMDMIIDGEPFSKMIGIETSFAEMFDVFENNGAKGLCEDSISKLPKCMFKDCNEIERNGTHVSNNCAICLQSFKNIEVVRELPKCRHIFHLKCIDEWLISSGSCPVCRSDV
ncbi:RING/U-box superfamily protein [Artemisia annua]|uniref:RING/U-box superfamily protein n=1 Tax=Artemisia annua TaxID=35608 RepID=A0A2U1QJG4_ARTAN|nr:RING/U-box superfamily protein [Artemisia annua]